MDDGITIDSTSYESADNIIKCEGYPPFCIANVVCTFNLGCSVNLKAISLLHGSVLPGKFNIRGFAAMIINGKYDGDYFTALIFATSNVVFTGGKTEDRARTGAWALVSYIQSRLGIPAVVCGFAIRNIVTYFSLGSKVELSELCKSCGALAHLKPELIHCGIVRNLVNPNQVLLVYITGKMVGTGGKTREEIIKMCKNGIDICRPFIGGKTLTRHALRYRPKKRVIGETELKEINDKLQEWDVSAVKNKKQKIASVKKVKENDVIDEEEEGDTSKDRPYVNYLNPLACDFPIFETIKFEPAIGL